VRWASEPRGRHLIDEHLTGVGVLEQTRDVQQRRLAGARSATSATDWPAQTANSASLRIPASRRLDVMAADTLQENERRVLRVLAASLIA
jgi:hypothetical protein